MLWVHEFRSLSPELVEWSYARLSPWICHPSLSAAHNSVSTEQIIGRSTIHNLFKSVSVWAIWMTRSIVLWNHDCLRLLCVRGLPNQFDTDEVLLFLAPYHAFLPFLMIQTSLIMLVAISHFGLLMIRRNELRLVLQHFGCITFGRNGIFLVFDQFGHIMRSDKIEFVWCFNTLNVSSSVEVEFFWCYNSLGV